MSKYEQEQKILDNDIILSSLCRAYNSCVRHHATQTAREIQMRVREIYHLSYSAFERFVRSSMSMQVSRRNKLSRMEKRIKKFLDLGASNFITITWNDYALNQNKPETRKKWVREILNDTAEDYIANIDFGKTTHREHYHGVTLNLDVEKFRERCRPFGFIKIERVIPSTEGSLALYVDKLCNHALKQSTNKMLMYCRKRKKREG